MPELTKSDKIFRYLDNDMSKQEKAAFEEALTKDEQLAQLLDEHRQAGHFIERERYRKIRNELILRGKSNMELQQPIRRYLSIAAGILLLILAGVAISQLNIDEQENITRSGIIASLDQPLYSGNLSGEGEEWTEAISHYQRGNCETAINSFTTLLGDEAFSNSFRGQQALLFSGYCRLKMNEPAAAIRGLKTISNTSQYYRPAQWFLAIAQIQVREDEKALAILKGISNDKQSEYQEAATELLQHFPFSD